MLEKLKDFVQFKNHSSKSMIKNGILSGIRAAILATDGFEQSELFSPKEALEAEGCTVHIISLDHGRIKAWNKTNWGKSIPVDYTVYEADPMTYDCLMLPGGVLNPDKLRINDAAIEFVNDFVKRNKPIAAICHGPQTLIETGMVKGRTLTSYKAISTDLINAGAKWVNQEVVIDRKLVTSRMPDDLPAFNREMINIFRSEIVHDARFDSENFVSVR